MHMMTKILLGVGTISMIISAIMIVYGFAADFSDIDSPPELEWEGTAPTTWDANLYEDAWWHVYQAEGANVSVTVQSPDEYLYFTPCSQTNNCNSSEIVGWEYVGEIHAIVIDSDEVSVIEFEGTGDVQVRKDVYGAPTAGYGIFICCGSIVILILGGISAAVVKDKDTNPVMLGQAGYVVQPQVATQQWNPQPTPTAQVQPVQPGHPATQVEHPQSEDNQQPPLI